MVFSAVVDTQRLAASGSARCYRQILHKKDDYPKIEKPLGTASMVRVDRFVGMSMPANLSAFIKCCGPSQSYRCMTAFYDPIECG